MTEFPDGYVHDYKQEVIDSMRAAVPEHLLPGLDYYVRDRLRPGHFLTAILENNLREAYQYANDAYTRVAIWDIVQYLNGCVPGNAWGSPAKVAAWLVKQPETKGEIFERLYPGSEMQLGQEREGDEDRHSG